MANTEELLNAVAELNEHLQEKLGPDTEHFFSFESSGFYEAIKFNDYVLWNSEEHERAYESETDDYEPLVPFLKKQFNKYAETLNRLKF